MNGRRARQAAIARAPNREDSAGRLARRRRRPGVSGRAERATRRGRGAGA